MESNVLLHTSLKWDKMKRFQECNKIVKFWRYRWYLLIPIKWCFYFIISYFNNRKDMMDGKTIWHIFIGDAQFKMGWYHTSDEVFEKLKNKK